MSIIIDRIERMVISDAIDPTVCIMDLATAISNLRQRCHELEELVRLLVEANSLAVIRSKPYQLDKKSELQA